MVCYRLELRDEKSGKFTLLGKSHKAERLIAARQMLINSLGVERERIRIIPYWVG